MVNKTGEEIRYIIDYPCTNESIPAIITGLDLKSSDIVVSIAGSGDVPFAIAPYVKKVYVVDNNKNQIRFMREQMGCLKEEAFEIFCRENTMRGLSNSCDVDYNNLIARKKYFEKIFSKVRKSIPKIEVVESDILSFLGNFSKSLIDKVYFSNALSRGSFDKQDFGEYLCGVKIGGLSYSTSKYKDFSDIGVFGGWGIRSDLTRNSGKIQKRNNRRGNYDWFPVVYERVK